MNAVVREWSVRWTLLPFLHTDAAGPARSPVLVRPAPAVPGLRATAEHVRIARLDGNPWRPQV